MLLVNLISNLGILVIFKYSNFIIGIIEKVSIFMGGNRIETRFDILLPVGISFYTFQALSYTFDVYKQKIQPEKNILKYALYVSFFPQLVAGPIERSTKLLPQIQKISDINLWNYSRIRDGLLMIGWGLFQKLVIADRASILVNNVVNNYSDYGMMEICIASVLFAFQIYCDFGGYTYIARGSAKVMGFELMNNFKQPYLATSIKDFWRRWHISLTSWFTDYLYIPLGGNRKGNLRKYINIIIVFGISGLWHGASEHFIAWGLIHACYQIAGDIKSKIIGVSDDISFSTRIRKMLITFGLVDFAWIFFMSNSINQAISIIKQMFTATHRVGFDGMGLDIANLKVLLMSILILMVCDIAHEKNISILQFIAKQEIWFKLIIYLGILWSIIMLGIYGVAYDTSGFIYFQF